MKKRIWGIFVVFALVLSVCSLTIINADNAEIKATETVVAEINGKKFSSIEEAILAVNANEEIILLSSATNLKSIKIDKPVTLNLNGYNISFQKNERFLVQGGKFIVKGTGKIREEHPNYAPIMLKGSSDSSAIDYSVVTIESNVILEGWAGLFINHTEGHNYGMVANVYGTLIGKKDLNGSGGIALYVNGGIKHITNPTKITLEGAKIQAEAGNGLLLSGYTETTISNSNIGISQDMTGIEIRAGKITITNSIISGGTGDNISEPNGSGSTTDNSALAIMQHTGGLPLEVVINSGTFTGTTALKQSNIQSLDSSAVDKIKITVKDGTFNGIVYSENVNNFISKGKFTTDVSTYLTTDSSQKEVDGKYVVYPKATGVTLSSDNALLAVGETTTLTATLAPTGTLDTVTWKSSDGKIATVENGKVTAVAPGTAKITATVNGKAATCTVTVYKVETVTPPTVDTTKPVEEVTVGVNDKASQDVVSEIASSIINDIKSGNNNASVNTETANKLKEAADAGKTITTEVKVEKISADEVNKEAKETIIQLVSEETTGEKTSTIVEYLDLSILLKADGVELGTVNELGKEVAFTVAIPEELIKEGRVFYVVRVHEGVAEKLPVTLNAGGTITFKTDKFSTYALVYEDGEATTPITPTDDKKEEIKSGVDTGDTTNTTALITLMGLAIVVAVGTLVSRKKYNK